jgi:alcohol/geraniol dehydrogenase (NADP+)
MVNAYAVPAASKPLEPFHYHTPELKDHEVEIGIDCCGLCYSDVHLADNDWKISKYPLVPGHEVIGKVIRKGAGVKNLEIGQRVGVGWQCGSCLNCEFCLRGEETVCASKIRTCVDRYGGFADKITVDSNFVYPIPAGLDSIKAAPLLCAGITVYSPFRLYDVKSPMSVAVIGIGGLGHLALQFARALGLQVTAVSHSPGKEAEARKFGAHHFLPLSNMNKASNSFDFILATANADLDWALAGQMLRPRGKLCFVGRPPGDIKFPASLLISGNRSICGSGTGSRALMAEMLQFSALHHIEPQVEVMPMSQINEAVKRLKSHQARYRIVLTNSP